MIMEEKIAHPVLLNNFYVHTYKEKKESLVCHEFMRGIVLTVHKSVTSLVREGIKCCRAILWPPQL